MNFAERGPATTVEWPPDAGLSIRNYTELLLQMGPNSRGGTAFFSPANAAFSLQTSRLVRYGNICPGPRPTFGLANDANCRRSRSRNKSPDKGSPTSNSVYGTVNIRLARSNIGKLTNTYGRVNIDVKA